MSVHLKCRICLVQDSNVQVHSKRAHPEKSRESSSSFAESDLASCKQVRISTQRIKTTLLLCLVSQETDLLMSVIIKYYNNTLDLAVVDLARVFLYKKHTQ